MSIGNLKDQGNKGNNLPYQLRTLQLLSQIDDSINSIPGLNYVTRTTTYQATAPGPGYLASDILVRYDIIDLATSAVVTTIWFNQNSQLQLPVGSPTLGTFIPLTPPTTVFIGNGALGAAVNIQDGGNVISIDDAGGSLTVDGTVTLLANSGVDIGDVTVNNTGGINAVNIQDGGNSITVDDGGGSLTVDATQSGVWSNRITDGTHTADVTAANALKVDGSAVTQPVSGTLAVSNFPLVQPVSGTVTANQGTSPWVVSGTVDIGTIPEVEIKNDSGNPIPVNGTVAATQSGTWNINNISGTVSLPTGAATEATLSSLNTKFAAVVRTPTLIRATGVGNIGAGARSISVYNAGSAAGSILGAPGNILPGEIFNFDAGGENDTLSAFAYDGAGTTLVITFIS